MNILVTGSEGQLGKTFKEISKFYPTFNFDFHDADLDITDKKSLNGYFGSHNIDCVINCAAYTAVEKAEIEIKEAFRLNSDALLILSELSKNHQFRLIHYSTDYIFDGVKSSPYIESDAANPLSVYGNSKLSGELKIISNEADAFIIRTSWLFSAYGNNFVKTILRSIAEGKELRIVKDQTGTPTYAKDLANMTLSNLVQLHPEKVVRVFHYSNEGETNWYEFAKTISDYSPNKGNFHPVKSNEYFQAAKRPPYSVMSKELIKKTFDIFIPQWSDSLKVCILEILSNGN